jgi:F0F1-type ATP synthase assembly protein I
MGMRSYRRPARVSALQSFAAADNSAEAAGQLSKGTGYTVLSYLIAGMLAYGGIGWLIGHFTNVPLLFPAGMLVGLAISVGWIIYRYGRPHKLGNQSPEGR